MTYFCSYLTAEPLNQALFKELNCLSKLINGNVLCDDEQPEP
jgi:hypothetical protein